MEKILDVLRPLFPFVRNPYAPHSFLRLDAFHKQFTVVCTGEMKLPLNDHGLGYRQVSAEYTMGHRSSIEDAIRFCTSKFHDLYVYPQIKAGAAFEPHLVEIFYTAGKAYRASSQALGLGVPCVLWGVVEESEIIWRRPDEVVNEIHEFQYWLDTFQRQFTAETCTDEVDIARIVGRAAPELKKFADRLKWRNFALKALDQTGVSCVTEQYPSSSGR
ncbi:hypothetical protein ACMGT0_20285 [Pseudomonas sp. RHF3.3-3]|uniref:Uncharacterized protein n=1 Tax=Pseudomonas asplenii TaxID=53407 RepID=A0A0N0E3Q3_9PSED|nr:hypothetical protein [Pseudomonas fuscovaginae]KPA90352.1 hypothetical protein PF66_03160 [Pseudomonas fuscovaginae]